MKKIVVLGSSGLLGHWLVGAFSRQQGFKVVCLGRSPSNDIIVDLTQKSLFIEALKKESPDIILNLVAEANVDFCEQQPEKAIQANVLIPQSISEYLKLAESCKAIHISTDHVYDGPGLKTEDQITLKNVYAKTKYEGEKYLSTRSFVLRTNFFGKSVSTKDSFSDWVVKSFKAEAPFTLFNDSFFSPVHWSTIYDVILKCFDSNDYGIYNLGSSTCLSKADFAIEVAKELNVYKENYRLLPSAQTTGRAVRPLNMCMNSTKLSKVFSFQIGSLENQISKLKKEYL
jgi:dTDP-4-dehydrorhamnose reductase